MQIQITWTANWAGNHQVCYREVGTPTFTCQTVAAVLGVNSLVIDVPTNFCDDISYEGYVLAECSDPVDDNLDGFPDASSQFTILITTQTDPCEPYEISCDTVAISGINIDVAGTGYLPGEQILANGSDLVATVGTVGGSGEITSVVLSPGFFYAAVPALTISTAGGVGASLTAILGNCLLSLSGCDGTMDDGLPVALVRVNVEVGDSIYVCSDGIPNPSPPPATCTFTVTNSTVPLGGTCNCLDCVEITVSNPTGGNLQLQYTTCNDPAGPEGETAIVMYQETIVAGASNVIIPNCAILSSIYAEAGLIVVTYPCPVSA